MESKGYETEWCLLQNQFDSYEKYSLLIKLAALSILFVTVLTDLATIYSVFILLVVWLQDAIWKTFQSRIETRLLLVEKCIAGELEATPFQFNRDYQNGRLSSLKLLIEYTRQAIRPTVAFPHLMLVVLLIAQMLI